MSERYLMIDELVAQIDEPNREGCARLLAENRALFASAWGSTTNHQAWPGGYLDHITEVMNVAVVLHERLGRIRPLPFSRSDLLLVVYLHDVEKPWKYELGDDGKLRHRAGLATKEDHQRFRAAKLAEYRITLTAEQENGIRYAEGELADYSNRRRVMGPLAAAAHMCDVASARLWFDHPLKGGDPWPGARRA
jgi:hypothetical protein